MDNNFIIVPVLVQVFLTLGLYVYLAIAKSRAAARGQVNEERRALYEDAWPETVQKINNSIRNQFEVPVLFYVLVFIFWTENSVNIYIHVLAWLFVLSRLIHAYIHTRTNYVPHRRKFFTIGWFLILIIAIVAVSNI